MCTQMNNFIYAFGGLDKYMKTTFPIIQKIDVDYLLDAKNNWETVSIALDPVFRNPPLLSNAFCFPSNQTIVIMGGRKQNLEFGTRDCYKIDFSTKEPVLTYLYHSRTNSDKEKIRKKLPVSGIMSQGFVVQKVSPLQSDESSLEE